MIRHYRLAPFSFVAFFECASGGGTPGFYSPPPIQNDAGGGGDDSGSQPPASTDASQLPLADAGEDMLVAPASDVATTSNDATTEQAAPVRTCSVTFTVHGVTVSSPEAGTVADAGDSGPPAVYVVGSDSALGGTIPVWTITAGLLLQQQASAADTWTGSVVLTDQEQIIFKFVEVTPENPMGWESLGAPFTNRSLKVDCSLTAVDAGTQPAGPDGGPPAVGKSYTGTFGVRPPDASGP
jgi:hypothetical protein